MMLYHQLCYFYLNINDSDAYRMTFYKTNAVLETIFITLRFIYIYRSLKYVDLFNLMTNWFIIPFWKLLEKSTLLYVFRYIYFALFDTQVSAFAYVMRHAF